MPHKSKSYCVTAQISLPQPHVEYKTEKPTVGSSWSPWILFSLVGLGAIAFVVCMNMLGGRRLFLKAVDPIEGLVPIIHQGELQVYPKLNGSNNGIMSRYNSFLMTQNLALIVDSFTKLLEKYPKDHGTDYSNCWLENPSEEKPCFFDSTWVTDLCSSNSSYGYEEEEGFYNPCFILRLELTGSWSPVARNMEDHHDHGFLPVNCFIKNPRGAAADVGITVYPSKGFSRLFFPVSKFDAMKYLAPLVAVKLDRIQKRIRLEVECSVITPNALILRNNGRVAVTFTS